MTLNELESCEGGATISSGGSLTLNIGLWGLRWETDRSVREKGVKERDVWACVASGGSLALVSATGAGGR